MAASNFIVVAPCPECSSHIRVRFRASPTKRAQVVKVTCKKCGFSGDVGVSYVYQKEAKVPTVLGVYRYSSAKSAKSAPEQE